MRRMIGLCIAIAFIVTAMPASFGAQSAGSGQMFGLTQTETELLDRLDYDHAWEQLEYLSSLGEKTAGSEEEARAQQYVAGELKNMSLDMVWEETFPVANWKHYGTTVTVVSHDDKDIPATTYGDCPSVWGIDEDDEEYRLGNVEGKKLIRAEVVDVGYGTAADFAEVGPLDDAVALIHRDDNTQGWPNVPVLEADLNGAIAAMFYGYFTGADLPDGIKQDSVFSPIPAISISPNSAAWMQELMADGETVEVEISGRVDFEPEAESINVAGVLLGDEKPDEYIVISGHIDTWWDGSNDDCSAVAVMLEMARLFSEAKEAGEYSNDRTLVFCSVGAEESGGIDGTWFNWLIGSYEFVCEHPVIMENLVMELNLDGGSFSKIGEGGKVWLEICWEVSEFVGDAIADLGYLDVGYYTPTWTWTDAWSFSAKGGGTAIQMVWGPGFDPYYHTQFDTIELQSEDMVAMVAELTSLMAVRADGALVVPLDFVPACDWAAGHLATESHLVPTQIDRINEASEALSNLKELVLQTNEYAAELEEMYAAAASDSERAAVQELVDELNRAIIDMRRIFTPWTLGEGGMMASWEPMMRPDQHATDFEAVNTAIQVLSGSGQVIGATRALERVRSMEWGIYCSAEVYDEVLAQMVDCFQYWGDDFDQAQAYVDVQDIYLGLKDGSMSKQDALSRLKDIRDDQLEPWFITDIETLAREWGNAAAPLEAVLA